jgi:transcriptional regulator with XRE-family HTH domain
MSEQPVTGQIPEWTLGWRMRRALEYADLSVETIAAEMGVGRSTVSRWLHDQGAPPRAAFVRFWATTTGVPFEWLTGGDMRPNGPGTPKAQVGRETVKRAPRFRGLRSLVA